MVNREMTDVYRKGIFIAISCTVMPAAASGQQASPKIYESYPPAIEETIQKRSEEVSQVNQRSIAIPQYIIVPSLHRWSPGQVLTVSFLGGNDALYAQIESAAAEWIQPGAANIKFRFKDPNGHYLHWTNSDTQYASEVRIAFAAGAMGGYWSLVGTDSKDRNIPGGGPNQASMNFEGFDKTLPSDWKGVVRHEFGHALGFEHEHQNPTGGCDFRFDDDPGYVREVDTVTGVVKPDDDGKRPGLYTYLGGPPNRWPRSEVDYNLRALQTTSAFSVGPFDKLSIMKYYFDSMMFVSGAKSPCYTGAENQNLSAQDVIGVSRAYPQEPAVSSLLKQQSVENIKVLLSSPLSSPLLKDSLNQKLDILK